VKQPAPRFNVQNAGCPARIVLSKISDKWAVLVLEVLLERTTRFNEVRRRVQGISQKMLTQTLRDLERNGLVSREIFPEVPPRVEYSLTPLGRSLVGVLETVTGWAEKHTLQVLDAQKKFDLRKAAKAATRA
jgi:DNA-binding HxlR family transcriptional regulator